MSESAGENAAVEQLLTERDALHGWLERLDAASVAASDAVRERVRRDYQRRLDQLTNALREHGDTIAEKLSADQAEHAELAARTDASRDALAEVELRHAVGEFPHDRFDSERRSHLSDIETFELSLAAVRERVGRMQEVLALVRRAPKSPDLPIEADEVELPSILDLAPMMEAAPTTQLPAETVESVEVLEPSTMDIGELAPSDDADQLLAIFDQEPVRDFEDDPPGAVPQTGSDFGPLSFRPSGSTPREPTPIGMPTDSPPRFIRPGDRLKPKAPIWPTLAEEPVVENMPVEVAEEVVPVTPAAAAPGIFSEEIVASGPVATPSAAVGRTLRCGECGAMNRPLEWYCEKCGAELTAV